MRFLCLNTHGQGATDIHAAIMAKESLFSLDYIEIVETCLDFRPWCTRSDRLRLKFNSRHASEDDKVSVGPIGQAISLLTNWKPCIAAFHVTVV